MTGWLSVVTADPDPRSAPTESVAAPTPCSVEPPAFRLIEPLECVPVLAPGSHRLTPISISAFDRISSAGWLEIDLDGADGAELFAYGADLSGRHASLDLSEPFEKITIATTINDAPRPLKGGIMRMRSFGTEVEVEFGGGQSFETWARVSLYRVDQYVIIVPEGDERSGTADGVAAAYGFLSD